MRGEPRQTMRSDKRDRVRGNDRSRMRDEAWRIRGDGERSRLGAEAEWRSWRGHGDEQRRNPPGSQEHVEHDDDLRRRRGRR
jgi:hypothetical protein